MAEKSGIKEPKLEDAVGKELDDDKKKSKRPKTARGEKAPKDKEEKPTLVYKAKAKPTTVET